MTTPILTVPWYDHIYFNCSLFYNFFHNLTVIKFTAWFA